MWERGKRVAGELGTGNLCVGEREVRDLAEKWRLSKLFKRVSVEKGEWLEKSAQENCV